MFCTSKRLSINASHALASFTQPFIFLHVLHFQDFSVVASYNS